MSRILKRPMFRIGGQANEEGIVSMAVPKRAHYAEPTGAASTDDNYDMDALNKEATRRSAILAQFAGTGRSQNDRLSDLLIRGGLNAISGVGAGRGTLAGLAASYKDPTEQYLKGSAEEEAFQRQLKLSGVTSALSTADAQSLAKAKLKNAYASQTHEAQVQEFAKTIMDQASGQPGEIKKRAFALANQAVAFKMEHPELAYKFHYIPKVSVDSKNNALGYTAKDIAAIPVGSYFLDPVTGTFKFKKYNVNNLDAFVTVDPKTLAEVGKSNPSVSIEGGNPGASNPKVSNPKASTQKSNTAYDNTPSQPAMVGEKNIPYSKQKFWEEYYQNNPEKRLRDTGTEE
jgi:hypothetical protein